MPRLQFKNSIKEYSEYKLTIDFSVESIYGGCLKDSVSNRPIANQTRNLSTFTIFH